MKTPIEPKFVLRGHKHEVSCIKFHPNDTNTLVSGDIEGNLKIWNLETRRCTQEVKAHGHILNIVFRNDLSLITQGREGEIKFWNMENISNPMEILKMDDSQYSFCKVEYVYNDNTELLICPGHNSIQIHNLKTKDIMKLDMETKFGMIMCFDVVWRDKTHILMVGFECGVVKTFNLVDLTCVGEMAVGKEPLTGIGHYRDVMVVGSTTNEIPLFLGEKLDCKFTIPEPGINQLDIFDRFMATAGWDHKIRIFDLKKPKLLAVLKYHGESVLCVSFQSCTVLASGSKDGRIALWNFQFAKKL
jgi:WD40 repeat protein